MNSGLFDLNFNPSTDNQYTPPNMNPPQGKGGEQSKPVVGSRLDDVQAMFSAAAV